ncbi:MAG TPA: EamA family transporter, partial [Rhizomicrobium sp.]|nr:EamA family transporter [Rhizomicrobium sp.]
MTSHQLSLRDALLALAVVFVWGTNFVVIRLGLNVLPPLFFATLRFTFVLLPLVFILPRPAASWGNLAFYGLAIGLMQFGLLFIAMHRYISPGLASLVVQLQVFFTIALAIWRAPARGAKSRTGERLKPHHIAALVLALAGMGVIAAHNGEGATIVGLVLVLGAALGWALGNQAGREATQGSRKINMLAYVVWSAMFAAPPLLLLSLLLEGPAAILAGLRHAGPLTWAAVIWQSAGNTMFGYGVWAILLARYPAATVAPLSLLVPVFG